MGEPTAGQRLQAHPFEETIDGYFPLHETLRQMLHRTGFAAALVQFSHAPMLHVPGLPPEAPVPLNIRSGFAGLMVQVQVCVTPDQVCAVGTWRWLTPDPGAEARFDGRTRLAEPCFVTGHGFVPGALDVPLLGAVAATRAAGVMMSKGARPRVPERSTLWGPFTKGAFHGPDPLAGADVPRATYFIA